MKRRVLLGLALSLLLAAAGGTQAVQADSKETHQEIQAVYDRWLIGWKSEDIRAIMAPFTTDFRYTFANGKVLDRKQLEGVWKEALKTIKSIESVTLTAGEVTVKGRQASDVATWKLTGVYTDPKGKDHPATELFVSRDLFVKTPKGWMFKRSKDLKVVITVDGKPVADPYDPFGAEKKSRKH